MERDSKFWIDFSARFSGKPEKEIMSYLSVFPIHEVINPPKNARIGGAIDQAEAVHFQIEDHHEIVFLPYRPIVMNKEFTLYNGEYFLQECFDLPHGAGCLLVTNPDDESRQAKFYEIGEVLWNRPAMDH